MTGLVVWQGCPLSPAPLAKIRSARGHGPVTVVDDAGRVVPFGVGRWLIEVVRSAWHRCASLVVALLSTCLSSRRAKAPALAVAGDGPVVLVLAVLPDLSHTFVYREVLALLRQRPDWRVVVLQRNDTAPQHAEASELGRRATFLPRDGITRAHWRQLCWLLRRRGRELVSLFRAHGGQQRELFGKLPLRDPRHPGNAFLLADLLRPLRPRHLHVYSSTWPANVVLGAAHLLSVPWSVSSYVDFEFAYSHKMLAEKLQRARFFRVVTAFCAERLRALSVVPVLPDERLPVIYLGLDLDDWRDTATLPGRGVLVSAARLVPKKGLHVVPAALAELQRQGLPFRWRVLGDGPELAALRASCAQHGVAAHVDFLGARDNATVRSELLAADAALLPCVLAADGERDGIPIFLVEAMALGVPAITTPVSGIPELVRDGDTGFLSQPDDSTSLAAVLARVLRDPSLAREVGGRGRAAVRRQLDVHDSARQLIACIER